jgi:hypothetical protein
MELLVEEDALVEALIFPGDDEVGLEMVLLCGMFPNGKSGKSLSNPL